VRAYVAAKLAGIDSLQLVEQAAAGALQPGQIRIQMKAASLNFRDLLVLAGKVGSTAVGSGLIPCSDGAGEVIEASPDVWRVKVGDRIALTVSPDWIGGPWQPTPTAGGRGGALPGVMRDEIVVGQHEAVKLPAHFSFAEGATLPCAGVTAWHALCGAAPLLPGMTAAVNPFVAGVTISPIMVGSRQDLQALIKAVAFHQLRPVIDEHFAFERLPDALRRLERGSHLGKIVIDF
jgi:NADPH:quinone reductase-like Zn-dependent oxidoreductase